VAQPGGAVDPRRLGRGRALAREIARRRDRRVVNAMVELCKVVPEPAAYVSESNFFEKDW
jgi:hypothetical protein